MMANRELERKLRSYSGAFKRGFKPLFLFLPPLLARRGGYRG